MSRSPDERVRRSFALPLRGDAGFTLIEVLVAFLVIGIVATAGASLTARGLRATMEARQLSQVKNLVSQQTEAMRGMPFYVSHQTNVAAVDVLDRYYPGLGAASGVPTGAPSCGGLHASDWHAGAAAWTGFVGSGVARCSFEPASGPFYRVVQMRTLAGSDPVAVVVDTQFIKVADGLNHGAEGLDPVAGYTTGQDGKDTPRTDQISATVTAVYGGAGRVRTSTSRTDIANRIAEAPVISAETHASAVTVDGLRDDGVKVRLEIGRVDGDGSVNTITTASVSAVAGSLQTETARSDGAAQTANAPGSVEPAGAFLNGSAISPGSTGPFRGLSLGSTRTDSVTATSLSPDPGFGQTAGPALAAADAGSFRVGATRTDLALLDPTKLVEVVAPAASKATLSATTNCPLINTYYGAAGTGWMDTVVTSPKALKACARARALTVRLFPSAAYPEGLIQVEVPEVMASCSLSGGTPASSIAGDVWVRRVTGATSFAPWSKTNVNGTTTSGDSLSALLTQTFPNADPVSKYIQSWTAFSGAQATPNATTKTAEARIPNALVITTVPMRLAADGTPDPDTVVRISVGRATCLATDAR